jgi:endonuclease YncB( thermonuclease family)
MAMWWCLASVVSLLGAPHGATQRNPVFSGVVTKVLDGDTIKVKVRDRDEKIIDLWGIDAPEADQPFGTKATKQLSKLVLNKVVIVEDFGGVGEVYVEVDGSPKRQVLANEQMVADGYAWYQRVPDIGDFRSAADRMRKGEAAARRAKKGLWSRLDAIAPWEWAKRKKSGR